MKLSSVSYTNFKGASASHKLAPLNLITGPNARGKTRIIQAIEVALCGFLPTLPRTNQGLWTLSSGERMDVDVEIDKGWSLARSWLRDKKGTIRADSSLSCSDPVLQFPSVLIAADEYFALSDHERVKFVFGLVKMPDSKEIVGEILNRMGDGTHEGNMQFHEELMILAGKLEIIFQASAEIGQTIQQALDLVVEQLKQKKSTVDAQIKNMTGTVRGLTELAQEPPKDVTKELEQARAALEQLVKEQAQLETELAGAARTAKARAELGLEIGAIKEPEPAQIAAINGEITKLRQETGENVPRPQMKVFRDHTANCILAEVDAGTAATAATIKVNDAKQDLTERTRLTAELNAAQQSALGLAELEDEYARMNEEIKVREKASRIVFADVCCLERVVKILGACRTMFADTEAAQIQRMLELNKPITFDVRALTEKVCAKRDAAKVVQTLTGQLAKLGTDADLKKAQKALKDAEKSLLSASAALKKSEDALALAEKTEQELAQKQAQLKERTEFLAGLMEGPNKVKDLRRQLDELGPVGRYEDQDAADMADTASKFKIKNVREEIAELEGKNRQFVAHKSEALTKQKAVQARTKLEAELAATKCAISLVEQKQASMVETAFVKILEVANKVTAGILKAPLCYQDGEIGMLQGKQFVSHRTFSGTEQCLAYAAMAVSLAVQSPIKLCLLDELGRLDDQNKSKLVGRLQSLLADGTLDQVVLIDAASPEQASATYPVKDMNWIQL